MEKKPNAFVSLFREQPLLFVVFFIVVILFVVILVVSNDRRRTADTVGDQASSTSGAFLVHQNQVFLPTSNSYSNAMIRDDIAYLARKNFDVYNPDKNPAVVFNISSFTTIENGKLSFKGAYEKQKGEITVDVTLLANDRVGVTIQSDNTKLTETKLPSASKRNSFIATLPMENDKYSVSYTSSTDSFIVTVFSIDDSVYQLAKTNLKSSLGDEYSDDDVGIFYPAYLKGDPAYDNTQQQYIPEEEYGDGGEPVGQ